VRSLLFDHEPGVMFNRFFKKKFGRFFPRPGVILLRMSFSAFLHSTMSRVGFLVLINFAGAADAPGDALDKE
jgi:hypothetical protein